MTGGFKNLCQPNLCFQGLLSLRPPPDSAYPTSNPFSIHRLLPGPGSPMHPSLSKSELQYSEYGLQHHLPHHESMYYQPPSVYQVGPIVISHLLFRYILSVI